MLVASLSYPVIPNRLSLRLRIMQRSLYRQSIGPGSRQPSIGGICHEGNPPFNLLKFPQFFAYISSNEYIPSGNPGGISMINVPFVAVASSKYLLFGPIRKHFTNAREKSSLTLLVPFSTVHSILIIRSL